MRIFICLILFLIIENVNAQQVSFRSDTVIDLHSHISRYDINGVCLLNDSIVLIFQKDEYKNREALVEKTGIFEITLYKSTSIL